MKFIDSRLITLINTSNVLIEFNYNGGENIRIAFKTFARNSININDLVRTIASQLSSYCDRIFEYMQYDGNPIFEYNFINTAGIVKLGLYHPAEISYLTLDNIKYLLSRLLIDEFKQEQVNEKSVLAFSLYVHCIVIRAARNAGIDVEAIISAYKLPLQGEEENINFINKTKSIYTDADVVNEINRYIFNDDSEMDYSPLVKDFYILIFASLKADKSLTNYLFKNIHFLINKHLGLHGAVLIKLNYLIFYSCTDK